MFSTDFISSTQLSKSIESVSTPIRQTGLTVQFPLSSFSQSESTATPETLFTSLTESSSQSALMGTSLLTQYTIYPSLIEILSQLKSIATTSSTPFPLSTTSTPLQTIPLDTISQYTLSSSILNLQSRDSFSFTIVSPTQPSPSYTPLFLSSSSLASSTTPTGGGGGSNGALSLPISIAAVTIFIVTVFILFIIGACLYRYVCCKCHCT